MHASRMQQLDKKEGKIVPRILHVFFRKLLPQSFPSVDFLSYEVKLGEMIKTN